MPIIEECKVVKKKGDYAVIELSRKAECENCKACAFNRRNTIRMTAKCETDCAVGDRVSVCMPEKSIKGSWLVLFVFPLILLLIAVLITAKAVWYLQVISIAIALVLGIGLAAVADLIIKRHSQFIPTVKEVVKEEKILIGEHADD